MGTSLFSFECKLPQNIIVILIFKYSYCTQRHMNILHKINVLTQRLRKGQRESLMKMSSLVSTWQNQESLDGWASKKAWEGWSDFDLINWYGKILPADEPSHCLARILGNISRERDWGPVLLLPDVHGKWRIASSCFCFLFPTMMDYLDLWVKTNKNNKNKTKQNPLPFLVSCYCLSILS